MLHLVAMLFATGIATVLPFKVANRRSVLMIGAILTLAMSVVGAITLVSGDWMTYEHLGDLAGCPVGIRLVGLRAAGLGGSLVGSDHGNADSPTGRQDHEAHAAIFAALEGRRPYCLQSTTARYHGLDNRLQTTSGWSHPC